jgi:hypothetical protein
MGRATVITLGMNSPERMVLRRTLVRVGKIPFEDPQ